MFPAQALAEEMLARGWRVKLSTDARGARYTAGFPSAVAIEEVASATFARAGAAARIMAPVRICSGIAAALAAMRRDPPDVVVGFGGYPSIPAIAAAWLMRLPRMIHEQNGVLGRVNQLFARRVARVACGTWPTVLPRGVAGVHTGNPVRAAILTHAGAPYVPPGSGPVSLVAIGGSQGARILSQTVPKAVALLPPEMKARLRLALQARDEDKAEVEAACAKAGVTAEIAAFFTDVPLRFAEAQLVVARAGASTVADLCVIGRPSILVPLAIAIRDEQTANARALVDAGAAVLLPESSLDAARLAQHIAAILSDAGTAARMAAAALSLARPDATRRLAALVEDLVRKDRP